ncbi:MAG: hypothetical protein RL417_1759 [Pseudomonadota bacterium]
MRSVLIRGISGLCLVVAFVSCIGEAHGQVTVNNILLNFPSGQRPIQNVTVGNSSDNPAYVVASLERVVDPESGGNKAEPSEDILISPKAFSIEPRGQRAVRFLLRNPPKDKEVVYRALFTPQDRGFGQEAKHNIQGRVASIRVLTGMGVLLFVEPPKPLGELHWIRTKDSIVFNNRGNVHVELGEGKACLSSDCVPLERKRVYSGATFEVKTPGDRLVTYLARTGAGGIFESVSFEPLNGNSSNGILKPAMRSENQE